MEITEVRIKLMENSDDRLQAFCSITFDDCFVVRDLKIIEGSSGPFVAMPSRKLTAHCPGCGCKNHLRAAHCNQCGQRLKEDRSVRDREGRAKLYADIAHPINSECRETIQSKVIEEFQAELERAQQPDYVSRYDEDYDDEDEDADDFSLGDATPAEDTAGDDTPSPSQAQIEPPESGPRGPHKAPTERQSQQTSASSFDQDDDFGAGIF